MLIFLSIESGETATRIKDRIKKCDKFILLATNDAIASKWCNWELGYGDACKYKKHIAILPIKPKDISYRGSEYMEIYPYIIRTELGDRYYNGTQITPGYYVMADNNIISMFNWLNS